MAERPLPYQKQDQKKLCFSLTLHTGKWNDAGKKLDDLVPCETSVGRFDNFWKGRRYFESGGRGGRRKG